ncbi:hypothetical protein ABPG75_005110 [Micractinium tetrahymenae]
MAPACLRIGVDCGGTSTDAVVLDERDRVLGWAKATTTEDVLEGVVAAVQGALRQAGKEPGDIAAVMLGTTQFVNAAVQLRGLARVAVVRLCGPATHALPPCCDMPPSLRAAVGGCTFLAAGGFEYDGHNELSPVDEAQLRGVARQIVAAGIRCIVLAGVFSPVNASQEHRAAAVLADEAAAVLAEEQAAPASSRGSSGEASMRWQRQQRAGSSAGQQRGAGQSDSSEGQEQQLYICLSSEVGQLGLLERENAAVLNAALLPLAQRVVPACEAALAAAGLVAQLWFTGNDGCLLSARDAMRMPVATFQSGPVNSLRGAALLTGMQDGIVVDIGGTTTDVGVLVGGLPRPAPRTVRLAGAPTNFQMPDVQSIGLGGGSLLRSPTTTAAGGPPAAAAGQAEQVAELAAGGPAAGAMGPEAGPQPAASPAPPASAVPPAPVPLCTVGPDSVGSQLVGEALSFGGSTATATDAAVLLGRMEVAGASAAAVQAAGLGRGQAEAAWVAIQRMLEEAMDHAKTQAGDVPVIVVGGGASLCGPRLRGASAVLRPQHAPVANAVGAAIAQVGGSVDAVLDLGPTPASRAAVLVAAQRQAEERAVAAGARPGSCWVAVREEVPLAYLPGSVSRVRVRVIGELEVGRLGLGQAAGQVSEGPAAEAALAEAEAGVAGAPPSAPTGEEPAAAALTEPAPVGLLPSPEAPPTVAAAVAAWPPLPGRGEEPLPAALAAWRPQLSPSGEWLLAEPDLHLIAVGCGILGCGGGGSPGRALLKALMELQRLGPGSMRVVSPAAVPDDHLVIDAGYMGAPTPKACHLRSRPQMMTSAIYGLPVVPAALADEKGNAVVVQRAADTGWLERLLRPLCTEMGCSAGFSARPLTGAQLRQVVVPHSLSLAWLLGQAAAAAHSAKRNAPAAIVAAGGGSVLFTGKVVDVRRQTSGGFSRGQLRLAGSGAHSGRSMLIDFQNENLVACLEPAAEVVASVPDLICCVEAETGLPIATEEMRYGLRAAVLGLPAHPLLTTGPALQVVGPAAFGHDNVCYAPLAPHPPLHGIPG